MTDRFPDDLFAQISKLEARIALLEAQQGQRPAVTKASQGWLLEDMSIPSVAVGQVQIGANGGEFFAVGSDGTVKRMFTAGEPVDTPSVDLANAPASYEQAWAQDIAQSASNVYQSYILLLAVLRAAGVIES